MPVVVTAYAHSQFNGLNVGGVQCTFPQWIGIRVTIPDLPGPAPRCVALHRHSDTGEAVEVLHGPGGFFVAAGLPPTYQYQSGKVMDRAHDLSHSIVHDLKDEMSHCVAIEGQVYRGIPEPVILLQTGTGAGQIRAELDARPLWLRPETERLALGVDMLEALRARFPEIAGLEHTIVRDRAVFQYAHLPSDELPWEDGAANIPRQDWWQHLVQEAEPIWGGVRGRQAAALQALNIPLLRLPRPRLKIVEWSPVAPEFHFRACSSYLESLTRPAPRRPAPTAAPAAALVAPPEHSEEEGFSL